VDGDGPERQKDAILRFCRAHGLGQPSLFNEMAVSGTVEAMDRPEFVSMTDAIKRLRKVLGEDTPVCIVVERQDRIARDLIVQELLLAECSKLKIPVYSADQNLMQDLAESGMDPTRKMLRQILGVVAEWEKSVLVMKLRSARDRKRTQTGRCEGPLPFGATDAERNTQAILLTLHHSGCSYAEIAEKANEMSIRNRGGRHWTRGAVYQAVTQRGVKTISR
jgi:DNA invertase Pin-like site-specific DNA recombinase